MKSLCASLIFCLVLLSSTTAFSHCEIPCGIFDDKARVAELEEHITTIETSRKHIIDLEKSDAIDYNQLVRWVMNKEEHANKIQHLASQYFLHQRIKPVDPEKVEAYQKYQKELELLHHISFYAMKAKQSTEASHIEALRSKVEAFSKSYFGEE